MKQQNFRPHEHVLGANISLLRGSVMFFALLIVLGGIVEMCMTYANALYIYPRPSGVISNIVAFFRTAYWYEHVLASATRVAVGIVIGAPLGFLASSAMLITPFGRFALNVTSGLMYGFPRVAIFFILLAIMGLGEDTKWTISIYIAFLTQMLVMTQGVSELFSRNTDIWADVSILGPSRLQAIRYYVVPMLLPDFFRGILLASAFNWTMLVLSENAGAYRGLAVLFHRELSAIDVAGAVGFGMLIAVGALTMHIAILGIRKLVFALFRM